VHKADAEAEAEAGTIFSMEWMVGVAQLDAVQRKTIEAVINAPSQNHWIKGFAGTGKTIVLTHILKRLAAKRSVSTCFATYTHALKEMVESGLTTRELAAIKTTTFNSFRKLWGTWDFIVADEMQDIKKGHLESIQSKTKSLVIAADPAQRIYRFSVKEDELNRSIRPVKVHKLLTIHRINLPVFTVATTIYPDSGFSPSDAPDDDREPVQLMESTTRANESKAVLAEASRVARAGSPSVILVPSNALLWCLLEDIALSNKWGRLPSIGDDDEWDDPFGAVNQFLAERKSPLQLFGSKSGSLIDSDTAKTVYLMTYHNAKGLEFPYVFMPYLTEETILEPMKNASFDEESRIFFVAATRAKERLYLSYHGDPHWAVRVLKKLGEGVIKPFTQGKRRF